MKFEEYENSEQLLQRLQQYAFEKNDNHDTVDLELEALSRICIHRIIIFENSIENLPCGIIGEKFTTCINLIKHGDHYYLVLSSEKHKISGVK